jgi:hypothetical protein
MSSIKELLHNAIESLSDEEARQLLEFARRLRREIGTSLTLERLAGDAAFEIPSKESWSFHTVEAIQGRGIAASKLLVGDRR